PSLLYAFLALMLRRPPRSPLFPYTTLFDLDQSWRSNPSPVDDQLRRTGAWPGRRRQRPPRFLQDVRTDRMGWRTSAAAGDTPSRSEEHTSELQSREKLVCRLLREKKKTTCD